MRELLLAASTKSINFVTMQKCGVQIFLYLLLFAVLQGCYLSKNVPEGKYLLEANEMHIPREIGFKEDNLTGIVRQQPNSRMLGIPVKLIAFNTIDSTKVAQKRIKKNARLQAKNEKRLERTERINQRRINKALERGEKIYRPRTAKLKDTLNPRPFFREWLKYDFGEAPRVFDSLSMEVSLNQLSLYLNRKGFFASSVTSKRHYDHKKRKVVVHYHFEPGQPHYFDSIVLNSSNSTVIQLFEEFQNNEKNKLNTNKRFDSDQLASFRNDFAIYMRDMGVFGFRSSYVSFVVDTLRRDHTASISVNVAPRMVEKDGEMVKKPFAPTTIRNVHFHYLDTMNYAGNFKNEQLNPRNIQLSPNDRIPTFDTLRYDWYEGRNPQFRGAYFYFNEKLGVRPELLEYQNFLEENNLYRGKYVDQSFNRLIQLDLFNQITPELRENEDQTIDVHYFLSPSKRQLFIFEPRATNSNGFLGVESSINYQHKNLFGGGERLKISFSGGFESQPPIFDETESGNAITNAGKSFNAIEFGPSVELQIPGLYPVKLNKIPKRQMPRTAISAAYNVHNRDDFNRRVIQLSYNWRFFDIKRTQVFTIGIPLVGGFQFLNIEKEQSFEDRLIQQNDLFLINAYSNQFIWKDVKLMYQYSNQEVKSGKLTFSYSAVLDVTGNTAAFLTRNNELGPDGFKTIQGVRYSQFVRLDNDLRLNHQLKGERSLNYRLQIGAGLPYGNNGPNLPFDYSFFAGGANDNRGFRARSLGPGVYEYFLDTNRTATEIGDIRFGGSLEYRFGITSLFKGAVFTDFGNIWTINQDNNRDGGRFTSDWFRQLSLAGGVGLRVDFDFLVARLDLGFPIRHPALPVGSQWIFQSRDAYREAGLAVFGEDKYLDLLPKPFRPQLHIGIGYPF